MATIDRVLSPNACRLSTAVTVVVAGWFAITFAVTVAGVLFGA